MHYAVHNTNQNWFCKVTLRHSTCVFREERAKFIRLKYTDRKFVKEEDDVDPEVELALLKESDSDVEKLLEESGEVEIALYTDANYI